MEQGNKKSGGPRKGSGAKPKYGEPTTTFGVRSPVSKVNELQEMIRYKLLEWSVSDLINPVHSLSQNIT
mgnify:FL=1